MEIFHRAFQLKQFIVRNHVIIQIENGEQTFPYIYSYNYTCKHLAGSLQKGNSHTRSSRRGTATMVRTHPLWNDLC